jgi:MICOS complex subunit MIC60
LTVGVYGASTLIAFQNERFHDFFIEFVPYGERIMEYAGHLGWRGHLVEPQAVLDAGRAAVEKQHAASGLVSATQKWIDKTKENAKESSQSVHNGAEKLKATSDALKIRVVKNTEKVQPVVTEARNDIKHEKNLALSDDILNLTRIAEEALTDTGVASKAALEPSSDAQQSIEVNASATTLQPTYTERLPIGFEAPPGFVLPSPPKPITSETVIPIHPPLEVPATPIPLPLVAPAISEFSSSEPVLAQIASTIDNLAVFVKDNPSASTNSSVKDILDTAQTDLTQLGERLQRIKEEERDRLEAELDDQAREYSLKLLQQEMEAQDKMDLQEEEWRKFSDQERQHTLQMYRAKLEQELQIQSEIINQR